MNNIAQHLHFNDIPLFTADSAKFFSKALSAFMQLNLIFDS